MILVSFESIDGAGGTSATKLSYEALSAEGYNVGRTASPYKASPFEPAIRSLLRTKSADNHTLLSLFLADREYHWEDITTKWDKFDILLTDRWHLSTLAYQVARSKDTEEAMKVIRAVADSPVPHADLYLHINPGGIRVAQNRLQERGTDLDSFETDKILQDKVLTFYEHYGAVQIDGTQRPSKVALDCCITIKDRLVAC